MDKFGDPGFHRHVAVSQVLGLAALRLADSLILPINATTYSTELSTYLSHTRSLASDLGFPVDKLGFGKLGCAIGKLEQRAVQLHAEAAYVQQRLECLSPGRDLDGCRDFSLRATMRKARQINKRLAGFERGFIDKKGLQGRPWYRSLVQCVLAPLPPT